METFVQYSVSELPSSSSSLLQSMSSTTMPPSSSSSFSFYEIIDLSTDDEESNIKIIEDFINLQRECPICYELFSTSELAFAPCSHFCCASCFKKLRDEKCPICMVKMIACIQYEKSGDNLKYSIVDLP